MKPFILVLLLLSLASCSSINTKQQVSRKISSNSRDCIVLYSNDFVQKECMQWNTLEGYVYSFGTLGMDEIKSAVFYIRNDYFSPSSIEDTYENFVVGLTGQHEEGFTPVQVVTKKAAQPGSYSNQMNLALSKAIKLEFTLSAP